MKTAGIKPISWLIYESIAIYYWQQEGVQNNIVTIELQSYITCIYA